MDSNTLQNPQEESQDEEQSTKIIHNIKSKYILQKLFENLHKKRALKIIKNNKKTQKQLDIDINTYKVYCETYSSIEIEIIPIPNLHGKFINFAKEEDKNYCHIYFDNNNEEIKRYELNEDEKIGIIKIVIDWQIKSFNKLFEECNCIKSVNFKRFYRNNIDDMSEMFSNCLSLNEINLSHFNTEKVTNMMDMFSLCQSLKEVNLSNFKTDNVTDMSYMFSGCSSIKELNLYTFKTDKITNMSFMFYQCGSLENLNISNFNTDKVTNMRDMFSICTSLKELNISSFNTNKVTNMNGMFYSCLSLENIVISKFSLDGVTDMEGMFSGCSEDLKTKVKSQIVGLRDEAFK